MSIAFGRCNLQIKELLVNYTLCRVHKKILFQIRFREIKIVVLIKLRSHEVFIEIIFKNGRKTILLRKD